MLRRFKLNKTHAIPIVIDGESTVFNFKSMTIQDKSDLLYEIQTAVPEDKSTMTREEVKEYTDRAIKNLCQVIYSIEGEDGTPEEVLSSLENYSDLQKIAQAVCNYCILTPEQVKNLNSSSAQLIPESAGNAVKNANPEKEPVSIIPTAKDTLLHAAKE